MVTARPTRLPASRPTLGLAELDARLSRLIEVPGGGIDAGETRTWHYLDNIDRLAGERPAGTILAVHGNPTWSYLWRRIVTAAADREQPWRVIAVDQLEMGFSERTGAHRTLAQRVDDLGAFTEALELEGPVVTLGHDWGGVISLGWALHHRELLAGVAVLNTAVHHPAGRPIPAPLRLAGARGMLAAGTQATSAFLDVTLSLAHPPLTLPIAAGYRAPYRSAARRDGIRGFVADIPADDRHESRPALDAIAEGLRSLDVPALMLWGPRDPIFSDRYLDDLIDRMPHADVHRFEGAGHLIAEDAPYADAMLDWLAERVASTGGTDAAESAPAPTPFTPLWSRLEEHRDDTALAVADMSVTEPVRVSWSQLARRVRQLAAGLHSIGVRKGDRVSLLVQPGPTLTAVVYACLRIGAVVVVADAGLGVAGLGRAIRGAQPDVLIGDAKALTAARVLGWPGTRVSTTTLPRGSAAALGVAHTLVELTERGCDEALPPEPEAGDEAAVLFTSGSTGPAKGVVYTHAELSAMRDLIADHFDVTADSGLVTGFAPFALLGPALGTRSVTPDMDVSRPRTLTAAAVAAAVRASHARIVFLSPAAILNVVDTASELTDGDREALAGVDTVLSTGAPISEQLLASVARVLPNATAHTPYGMTECLLVTDTTLDGIRDASAAPDRGVCVGRPIGEVRVRISALDEAGAATGEPGEEPGVLGEIVISAPHLKDHYDRLALVDRASRRDVPTDGRWHRTGDIGHLDADGRLWVEGRLQHVISTEHGPLAPVGPEQDIECVDAVRRAAVVGVGPQGVRRAVAVVETIEPARAARLAAPDLAAAIRDSCAEPLSAVFVVPQLPCDIRHNSKIDRSRLSDWAERMLSGSRVTAP
ncbi:Acyl-CoA synthetase (AMP-forming)/AMP-acid ligase II [Paramicrobacterium humi]|uniref:Acyl-CoA synthetase (AMP-forming)/AMP-acid ligase II n=1 Tax=Paramicrobacterium humi TaxID=640635 RepID=A0A1H4IYL1_9MICO|nr:alpha/beta fold hydrolase [Microbacterium humi]SEB39119.1 Acyl-CoA synthetase (AMP-forming)/AMP-acid ligase II [Microbacterium humi]